MPTTDGVSFRESHPHTLVIRFVIDRRDRSASALVEVVVLVNVQQLESLCKIDV
jgi:hypothetical protein